MKNKNVTLYIKGRCTGKTTSALSLLEKSCSEGEEAILLGLRGNRNDAIKSLNGFNFNGFQGLHIIIDEYPFGEKGYSNIYNSLVDWLRKDDNRKLTVFTSINNVYEFSNYNFIRKNKHLLVRSAIDGLDDSSEIKELYYSFLTDDVNIIQERRAVESKDLTQLPAIYSGDWLR